MKCKVCGKGRPKLFASGRAPGAYCDLDCYDEEVARLTNKDASK